MPKRDINGKFIKQEDDWQRITLNIPSIKRFIFWVLIFAILLPWFIIIGRLELVGIIIKIFEKILGVPKKEGEENGQTKKGSLFY